MLVDQRGPGASHPLLCPGAAAQTDSVAWVAGCAKELDADPRVYTTRQTIEDLDQVRVVGRERLTAVRVW